MSRSRLRHRLALLVGLTLLAAACSKGSSSPPPPVPRPAGDVLPGGSFDEATGWHLSTVGDATAEVVSCPDFAGNCVQIHATDYGTDAYSTQLVAWDEAGGTARILDLTAGYYRLYARARASSGGKALQIVIQDGSYRVLGELAVTPTTGPQNYQSDRITLEEAASVTFKVNLGGAANAGVTFSLDDLYLVREGDLPPVDDGTNLLTGGDFEGTFDKNVWNYWSPGTITTPVTGPCPGFTGNCFQMASTDYGAHDYDTQLVYSDGTSSAGAKYLNLTTDKVYTVKLKARASTAGKVIKVLLQDSGYATAFAVTFTLTDGAAEYVSEPFTPAADASLAFKISFGPQADNAGVSFFLDDLRLLEKAGEPPPPTGINLLTGGDFEGAFDQKTWNFYGSGGAATPSATTTTCTGFTGNCFRISSDNWGADLWNTQLVFSDGTSAYQPKYMNLLATKTYTINLRGMASTTGKAIQVVLQDSSYATASSISFTLTDTAADYTSGPFTLPANASLAYKINFGPQSANAGVTFFVDDLQLMESTDSMQTVANPTFDPAAGTYPAAQDVTLSSATPGASIRYTTDGSTDPTATTGTPYTGPIHVAETTTLRAIAFHDGMASSAVASATYTIQPPGVVVAPTFSPTPGTYTAAQDVTLSTETAGATVHYELTTDGSEPADPTAGSATATGAVHLALPSNGARTYRFKAQGVQTGYTSSTVASATYVLSVATVAAVTVNDFESATPASYPILNSSGALTAPVVDLAAVRTDSSGGTAGTTGNTSTKVLEVGSGGYNQYVRLPLTLPTGTSLADFGYVYVKAVFPSNGGDNGYKNLYAFIGATVADGFHATTDAIGSSTGTGAPGTTWREFFIPLDAVKAAAVSGTSLEIALGINRSGTAAGPFYLDDIRLYPRPVALRTFEADTIGTTTYPIINSSGALTAPVIATGSVRTDSSGGTGGTTGDPSAQVLEVGSGGYNQYVKLPLVLPAGTSLSDYKYVVVRAVFPSNGGDNGYKNIYAFIGTTISDGLHATGEAVGQSNGTGGQSTAWAEYMIPISDAIAAGVSGTSLEIALGINRSGTTTGPFYLDDIGLIAR
jgi:hypothetical protein